MLQYPGYLAKLISFLRKLPGIGFKSAEKIAFELLSLPDQEIQKISETFQALAQDRSYCETCFHLKNSTESPCAICDTNRSCDCLCIVATVKDVFSLERSKVFKGRYFVLGSLFSPIHDIHINPQRIVALKQQIAKIQPKEIIIALDATLEGDATALFLKQELSSPHVSISRLALGLPMGVSFEYVDSGTLSRAFSGRSVY